MIKIGQSKISYAVLPFDKKPDIMPLAHEMDKALMQSFETTTYEAAMEIASFLLKIGSCGYCAIDLLIWDPMEDRTDFKLAEEFTVAELEMVDDDAEC